MKFIDYATVHGAARIADVSDTRLREAIAAKRLKTISLADGTQLVRVADVRKIAANPLPRGRKVGSRDSKPRKRRRASGREA